MSVLLLSARPACPDDLTGTWRGTVTMEGQEAEFTATFSENGYFLFTYENSQGFVRTVELSAPGQIQFVPPGGGVHDDGGGVRREAPAAGSHTSSTPASSGPAAAISSSST